MRSVVPVVPVMPVPTTTTATATATTPTNSQRFAEVLLGIDSLHTCGRCHRLDSLGLVVIVSTNVRCLIFGVDVAFSLISLGCTIKFTNLVDAPDIVGALGLVIVLAYVSVGKITHLCFQDLHQLSLVPLQAASAA